MTHLNIVRADVDGDNKVTIAITKNIWDPVAMSPGDEAVEWGKLVGQIVKAVAKTMGEDGKMNEEIAEVRILASLQESMYSIEEPPVKPGEPIPGDDGFGGDGIVEQQ